MAMKTGPLPSLDCQGWDPCTGSWETPPTTPEQVEEVSHGAADWFHDCNNICHSAEMGVIWHASCSALQGVGSPDAVGLSLLFLMALGGSLLPPSVP